MKKILILGMMIISTMLLADEYVGDLYCTNPEKITIEYVEGNGGKNIPHVHFLFRGTCNHKYARNVSANMVLKIKEKDIKKFKNGKTFLFPDSKISYWDDNAAYLIPYDYDSIKITK